MVQPGGSLPGALGLLDSFSPFNMINSTKSSYEKELKNTDPKK